MSEVGVRLKEALELLRKSQVKKSFGNGWLYEMPWYVFVGPPGSGKTTALTNSGLNFPLSDHLGKKAVKGVGGTRSCDWWFTDEAVLIDTAGRYTTQDSDEKADAGAWKGFLNLLKKHRSRQPINGAIVTIGLSDLLESSEETRTAHARAIKARLKELHDELNIPFNVYVLFSKADRIEGFVEFFDDLSKDEREQVWGVTFDPADNRDGAVVGNYAAEFDALIERLNARQLERLQQETDIERRAHIFSFPHQVASLKDLTDRFLKEIFEPNRYEKMPPLRGVYFGSGVQHGTPINRLLGAMAATFGLKLAKGAAAPTGGRSYFLNHLLRRVIFAEANMVKADSRWEKRNKRIRLAVLGAAGAAILGVGGLWLWAFLDNNALVSRTADAVDAYEKKLAETGAGAGTVTTSDLEEIVPLLNDLRDLPGGYRETGGRSPIIASKAAKSRAPPTTPMSGA
jgi:type VI secretion system protein ImpL